MSMTQPIPAITRPFVSEITLPGSKSIALRQLAIAALTQGTTTLSGIPDCDDADAMIDCLQTMGVGFEPSASGLKVSGPMDYTSDVELNARMSGASTRLLIGLAALRSGQTVLDGHDSLRVRTNRALYNVLAANGCAVVGESSGLPVTIKGPIAADRSFTIDGSLSSQYTTALLLIAPVLMARSSDSTFTIHITGELVSRPYLDITTNEMAKRGITARWEDERTLVVEAGSYEANAVTIEGDATAASYFIGLATLHGATITLTNLGTSTHQGDYQFCKVAEQLGAAIEATPTSTTITGPTAMGALNAIDMTAMPDAAVTLITLAPFLPTRTVITGLSTLRHKECDRLACPAIEFEQLGIHAVEGADQIEIFAVDRADLKPHTLATYHDHRIAMAFSLVASVSGSMSVDDLNVVAKTYPNYWQDYSKLVEAQS